jgi:hypothetical protein
MCQVLATVSSCFLNRALVKRFFAFSQERTFHAARRTVLSSRSPGLTETERKRVLSENSNTSVFRQLLGHNSSVGSKEARLTERGEAAVFSLRPEFSMMGVKQVEPKK